jgi:hypothetical protein
MKHDIFVSYRRTDRELVAQVVQRLEGRGVGVWYDAQIDGGADWRETIVEALAESDMLVIFFSEECNTSRQLKKELAVADKLDKPVVPILIENTQPRGAYLYELADRNWIQAWPDPMRKIDELVDHLAVLAGKTEGGLAGAPPMKAPPAQPIDINASASDTAYAPIRIDAGAPPPGNRSASAAMKGGLPRAADAYIGRKGRARVETPNDILPFRWIDLAILAPLVVGFAWLLKSGGNFVDRNTPMFEALSIGILCLALVGFYGAVVFPVRYFMRQRPVRAALRAYAASSLILYGLLVGAFLIGYSQGLFPNDDPAEVAIVFAGVWFGFAILAFIVYAVLGAQRAVGHFRANIRKI